MMRKPQKVSLPCTKVNMKNLWKILPLFFLTGCPGSGTAENILYKEFGIAHEVTVASGKLSTEIPPMEMKIFKLKP